GAEAAGRGGDGRSAGRRGEGPRAGAGRVEDDDVAGANPAAASAATGTGRSTALGFLGGEVDGIVFGHQEEAGGQQPGAEQDKVELTAHAGHVGHLVAFEWWTLV